MSRPENRCKAAEPFSGDPVITVSYSVTTVVWQSHSALPRHMEAALIISGGEGKFVALIKTAYPVLFTWLVGDKSEDNYSTSLL